MRRIVESEISVGEVEESLRKTKNCKKTGIDEYDRVVDKNIQCMFGKW